MKHATKSRTVALFPGAFRPPHAAHFAAVEELASRPDVDEVVVIISNRSRMLPGTTKIMGPEVARQVWEIFLTGLRKVKVEVAPGTAIEHALAYFGRSREGDSLLFCLGEADQSRSDPRFSELATLSARHGVTASVVAARTGSMPVRATDLRDALRAGPRGRAKFLDSLPAHLTPAERGQVWQLSQDGLREISDAAVDRARALVPNWGLGAAREINCVRTGKLDPVIRIELTGGRVVFLKDARDTVEAGAVGNPACPKPAARIGVERRAIRRLGTIAGVELPDVVWFDKESRSLVLSEVCPGGTTLQSELERGIFDSGSAKASGIALAALHNREISPLRGDANADLTHWRRMLGVKTRGFSQIVQPDLDRLAKWSDEARENCFVHLDFVPKNVRLGSMGAGVIDLELSATCGDPAYDLGCLMAHYLLHGHTQGVVPQACQAFEALLAAYRRAAGEARSPALEPRMTAFAGAEILLQCRNDASWSDTNFRALAARLLTSGLSTANPVPTVESLR